MKIEYGDTTRDGDSFGGGLEPGRMNMGRAVKPDLIPKLPKSKGHDGFCRMLYTKANTY